MKILQSTVSQVPILEYDPKLLVENEIKKQANRMESWTIRNKIYGC